MVQQRDDRWRDGWQRRDDYAEVFYKRAVGELPEMESSKAVASLIAQYARPGDSILDVGCGGGHYLRSLRLHLGVPFTYTGVDATQDFLDVAQRAWEGTSNVRFLKGDIYDLPFGDGEFDIVTCNNLLYHLPSIVIPISELVRVARRVVVARTLVGDRSFRIQEILSAATMNGSTIDPKDEFTDDGEPRSFAYLNIYGRAYLGGVLERIAPGCGTEYIEDVFFDPVAIERSASGEWNNPNPTRILGGKQVIGYIVMPYHFLVVKKDG